MLKLYALFIYFFRHAQPTVNWNDDDSYFYMHLVCVDVSFK